MSLDMSSIFQGFKKYGIEKNEQPINEVQVKQGSKIELIDLEKGNEVWCGGNSGFCHDSIEIVKKVSFKYDADTGKKYKRIHLKESHIFDSRDGHALTSPTAYYLSPVNQSR